MGAKRATKRPANNLRKLQRQLQHLDPATPNYRRLRGQLLEDIQLAKAQLPRARSTRRPPVAARRRPIAAGKRRPKSAEKPSLPAKVNKGNLSKLLNPKNLQESLKSIGNLRGSVKTWLGYLQQADQLLDTLFITSSSLKETGVLEKLVKSKGKNLNTEDFTNILMALMNTPMGAQLFKGNGDSNTETESNGTAATASTASTKPGAK